MAREIIQLWQRRMSVREPFESAAEESVGGIRKGMGIVKWRRDAIVSAWRGGVPRAEENPSGCHPVNSFECRNYERNTIFGNQSSLLPSPLPF